MRHFGEVGHNRLTTDILSQCDGQFLVAITKKLGSQNFTQDHLFSVFIGKFDPDHSFPRYRRYPRRKRRHGARDIVRQPNDTAGFQARRWFQFIHCYNGAGANRNDFSAHTIIVQNRFKQSRVFFEAFIRQVLPFDHNRICQKAKGGQFIFNSRVIKLQAWLRLFFGLRRLHNRFSHRRLNNFFRFVFWNAAQRTGGVGQGLCIKILWDCFVQYIKPLLFGFNKRILN